MNKNTKGAIAVGAATVLLLGGGGTLAVWNSSADNIAGGTISAGQLSLAGDGSTGAWYQYVNSVAAGENCSWYADTTNGAVPINGTATPYTLVPGDDVIFCVDGLDLTAEGTNLFFTVDTTEGAVTVWDNTTTTPTAVALNALPNGVAVTSGITINNSANKFVVDPADADEYVGVDEATDVYSITAASGAETLPISAFVHVSLEVNDVINTAAQQYSFELGSGGGVDVTQVVLTPTP